MRWRRDSRVGSGAAETRVFTGHGYSFTYPSGWRVKKGVKSASEADLQLLSRVLVAPGGPPNSVSIDVLRYPVSITEENIEDARQRIVEEVTASFEAADGKLTSGPQIATLGGMPGFRFEGTYPLGTTEARTRATVAYNGAVQYVVSAQYLAADADEILRTGDLVEDSFRLT
jgi:hypothetical protein